MESSLQTSYYGTAGSRLYAVDWKGKVTEYDLESGLVAAPDKGLASAIEQSGLELGDRQGNADAAPVIFYGGEDPDTPFFLRGYGGVLPYKRWKHSGENHRRRTDLSGKP